MAEDFPIGVWLVSPLGIRYLELDDSQGVTQSWNGATGGQLLLTAWDDRFNLTKEFLGYSSPNPGGGSTIVPPREFRGFSKLYAIQAIIEGFGAITRVAGNALKYPYAKITISYDTTPRSGLPNETVRNYAIDISGEFFQAPKRTYKWLSDSQPVEENVGILLIGMEVQVEELRVTNLDFAKYSQYVGRINSAAFSGLPAETVLYLGLSSRSSIQLQGIQTWDVIHKFKWRQQSWNKIMRGNGTYGYVTPLPYELKDLNLAFS